MYRTCSNCCIFANEMAIMSEINKINKTAVRWVVEELKQFELGQSAYLSRVAIINCAERMERKQIEDAYEQGEIDGIDNVNGDGAMFEDAKEYYEQTYGK